MSTNLTALFETKFDGSGANAAKAGFAGWQDGITKANNASKTLGTNYDSMAEKLGKPIARVAYRNVAMDVLAMSGAMNGAGAAAAGLSQVFMGIGQSLMYIQPEIALAAIALVGLVSIYSKISSSTAQSSDNIRKRSTALLQDAEAARKAGSALRDLGTIDEKQYQQMIKLGDQREKDVILLQKQLAEKKRMKDAEVEDLQRQVKLYTEGGKGASVRLDLGKAMKQQAELEKALIAIGETSTGVADRQNQSLAAQRDLRSLQTIAIAQQQSQTMTMDEAVMALMDTEIRRSELENQFINTNSPKKAEAIQKEIDGLNALKSAYEAQISKLQTIQKAEESVMKQRASIMLRYMAPVESSWEMHGKKLVFNARKFLAEELRLVADQAATYLAIASVKYFSSGNFAMGSLAAAGAITIKALAGAGAALLGGGGSEAESVPSAGTTSPSLSENVGSETAQAARPMNITVQVNALHAGTAEQLGVQLVNLINMAQDVSGARLKAATVQTGGSWMAP